MKKKKSPVLSVLMAAAVVGILGLIWFAADHYRPTKERMDPNTYFGIESENAAALITDNGVSELSGMKIGEKLYLPASVVGRDICPAIFFDEAEDKLIVTTPEALETYDASRKDIVHRDGGEVYIALEFVQKYAEAEWSVWGNPDRVLVRTDFSYMAVNAAYDAPIRYRAGIKSPVISDVCTGQMLQNLELGIDGSRLLKKIDGWTYVRTSNGYSGYIEDRFLDGENYPVEETHEQVSKPYEHRLIEGGVNLIFHQTGNEASNKALGKSISGMTGMNVIAPTWIFLDDADGSMSSIASADYVKTAHEAGLFVWAVANDFDGEVNSSDITAEMLSSGSARTAAIERITDELLRVGADGICLDFEKITSSSAVCYLEFIRELSVETQKNGLVLSICNFVPTYTAYYNRKEQARVADYIICMCYDEHTSGSETAGSVASLPFVRQGIRDTLKEVPAEQVIAAIPFFTRLWTTSDTGGLKSRAMSMNEASAFVLENAMNKVWDEETGQWYASGKGIEGTFEIWLEDMDSLNEKLRVVSEEKIAGAAAWKLGLQSESVWTLFEGKNFYQKISVSGNAPG
ncbi:MAG: hypothetical protein K6E30_11005 [Lachnospiraceae bacterium]|nr:hypothetical protein [Lachnospiraceae bacterium]